MCVWTKEVLLSRSESNTMVLVIHVALFFIFNNGRIFGSVYVNFSFTFTIKKSERLRKGPFLSCRDSISAHRGHMHFFDHMFLFRNFRYWHFKLIKFSLYLCLSSR